jgi:predicted transcriptional regulator
MKIIEKKFRESLVCRVLGYPVSYEIVGMLLKNKAMTFNGIAKKIKRSKSTICYHLSKLRYAHVIRYEKTKQGTVYWIKYPKEVGAIMNACEGMVKRVTRGIETDY